MITWKVVIKQVYSIQWDDEEWWKMQLARHQYLTEQNETHEWEDDEEMIFLQQMCKKSE